VLVLQSKVGDGDDNPIVDHQVRIVRAANAAGAYTRALRLGADENATFKNQDGQVDQLAVFAPKSKLKT
jgi:hypothetical protein